MLKAEVLFREIKARGYAGGETRVKQFVRGLVPAAEPDPVVRYETEPGHQMQADWATVGRGTEKLKVFIATLGWSRVAYVEFCDDERVETLIGCHENAFVSFGGVPAEVLYDNMKTVVLERNTYGRGVHRFHAGFLDYAKHASAIKAAKDGDVVLVLKPPNELVTRQGLFYCSGHGSGHWPPALTIADIRRRVVMGGMTSPAA